MKNQALPVDFEPSALELTLSVLGPGDTLAAERLLLMLDGQDDETVEQTLEDLAHRHVSIRVEQLPAAQGPALLAARLDLERRLASQGKLMSGLPAQDPLRQCMEDMERVAAEITDERIQRALSGDRQAVEQLTGSYFPQILDLACELTGRGVLLQDLVQDGCMGLLLSLTAPDPQTFRQEALWQARQAMHRTVLREARAEGTGARLVEAMEDYRKADRELLSRLGRNPTVEEIAQQLGKDVEQTAALQRMHQTLRAMSGLLRQVPQETDEEQTVEHTAYFQSRQRIGELLSVLSEQDAQLLRYRFGLDGGLPLSPEDTGKRLGLTAQEVVDRETAAMALLRKTSGADTKKEEV